MIYCIPPENYPEEGQFIEEIKYLDENDFEWRIARIENGFIVKYFGDPYFNDKYFLPEINGKITTIKNTNCIFFQNTSFEAFMNMRTILKNGYTDDIHDSLTELFEERLLHSDGLLNSELL